MSTAPEEFTLLDNNGRLVFTTDSDPETVLPPGLYEVVWEGEYCQESRTFRHYQGKSILDEVARAVST